MQKQLVRIASGLGTAWKTPGVKRGFVASWLLFAGSLTPAYLPQATPWWDTLRFVDEWWLSLTGTALIVAAMVLYISAWLALRSAVRVTVAHWAVLFWWCLPLLAAPPIFSHDAYAYAAEGWLLRNGLNPYDNPISVLPGGFADQAAWAWRYTTAMYPPLSLRIFEVMVLISGNIPYLATLLIRIPALIGVGLICYLLPKVAERSGASGQLAAWFGVLNPILIVDFVGGMHNDALMLGLVLLAIWWAQGGHFWQAAALVGVAACVKQPAFLAFYPVALIGHPWKRLNWADSTRALGRLFLSLATSVVVFVGITFLTGLGFGWWDAAAVPGTIITMAPFTLVGAGLQWVADLFFPAATGSFLLTFTRLLGLAFAFGALVFLGLGQGRTRPLYLLSWGWLAFAIGNTSLYTWYLTWGGLLLPLAKPSGRIMRWAVGFTAFLLAYGAVNVSVRNEVWVIGFAGLAVMFWLIWKELKPSPAAA
ncbi:MAG: polyprenol phosphomannose-dependent alpha 1,6 mannosyltransferase MptB [Propionibacteriaceae bacterium]|nr:polyprenol phosphomannose-dependent alpha 1,6 mannosyltransferase MptB [Propionibacteriaceae bacterium]